MSTMPMNFADAPPQNDFSELIPHGALAFGILNIKWHNLDQGMLETPSKSGESAYLDCTVTITPNPANGFVSPWNKRKIFTRIGVAGKEAYINMGRSAIKAILETGRGAGPSNPNGYNIGSYAELDGLPVAVKIKIDPGNAQFPNEKNDVALWLSPVDQTSPIPKDWARLMANDVMPAPDTRQPKAAAAAKVAAPATPWAGGAAPAGAPTPRQGTAEPAMPNWLGGQTPAGQAAPAAAAPAPAPSGQPAWMTQGR